MNTFLTLIKTQLNTNFGISALRYRYTREKKKLWEPILIGLAIVAGAAPIIFLYVLLALAVFNTGLIMGQPEMVLTFSLITTQVLVLIFGIFYFISTFYFSNDLNMLIPLPIKPYHIVGSKFVTVMCNEYLIVLPIFMPPLVIYGLGTAQGVLYWVKAVIIMFSLPAIPLILDALFVMILMRFVNIRKSKDLLTIVGSFFALFLSIGINLFVQKVPQYGDDYLNYLTNQKGLIAEIGKKFPPSIWATWGMADNGLFGLGNFLLFVAVSVLLFMIMLWMANLVFYKGVLAGQEVSRKRKVMTREDMQKTYNKAANPVISIFIREWRLLVRTPVYMMNGLAGAIMVPLILVIMIFAQSQTPEMSELINVLNSPENAMYVALGGLGFMLFTGGMNLVASTSISREGKSFWISKMIPVSAQDQVLAKYYSGFLISAIGTIVTALTLVVFTKVSLVRILVITLIGLLASVSMTSFNLLLDLMHPKLVWNNPQEAMKQNMNGLLGMLASIVILGILGLAAAGLIILNAGEQVIYIVLAAISIILGLTSVKLLFAAAKARYASLEA